MRHRAGPRATLHISIHFLVTGRTPEAAGTLGSLLKGLPGAPYNDMHAVLHAQANTATCARASRMAGWWSGCLHGKGMVAIRHDTGQ
eukprot:1158988-Pelagomonas_calceolata.AAC.13